MFSPIQGFYYGPNGYTLPKRHLTLEQQDFIRRKLTITPKIHGAPTGVVADTFPAYRESETRMYVPYYFGLEHFGPPQAPSTLGDGERMSEAATAFAGTLRDYQRPVVEAFLAAGGRGGLLELPCAWGKTSASLYIAATLGRKTLVIVHKEFLMNQWIERIAQFLPSARVGRIQGPTIDTDGADIVLCMLQSLVQKNYPTSLFAQFGLTIIDEVHHISSQTFSNALFKVVSPVMLGLSATMDRKDGTTHVFKMFLGPVISKVERKVGEHAVEVRALTFKTRNPADPFNESALDFRGQFANSTMISRLCDHVPRNEFILSVLCDSIRRDNVSAATADAHKAEMDRAVPPCSACQRADAYPVRLLCCGNVSHCLRCIESIPCAAGTGRPLCPACGKSSRTIALRYEQAYVANPHIKPMTHTQTIVMAHQLNILEWLYRRIVCANLASVAYYVGGMSEEDLKRSERAQVILATYSMAAEALDIPSLTTEFLLTPKTDVVQIVGRVLRAKHPTTSPVIVDFVDVHDGFQRQWAKRRAWYKSQGYKIVSCDSSSFRGHAASPWRTVFAGNDQSAADTDTAAELNDPKPTGIPTNQCILRAVARKK